MAKGMKGIAFVSVCVTVLCAGLFWYTKAEVLLTLAITFGTIAYHFLMRLIVGGLINGLMHNRMDVSRPWFSEKKFEKKLYQKLRVKKWKGHMPTYDPEVFSAEKHSLDEIAQAMCQAETVHEVIFALSFLPLVATVWFGAFPVFLITSLCAAAFDGAFVIVQRYNRPRVLRLAKRRK